MAEVLKVDVNYLLTDDEEFLLNAESKYGSKGARQAKELMAEVTGLFAGGELAGMRIWTRSGRKAFRKALLDRQREE